MGSGTLGDTKGQYPPYHAGLSARTLLARIQEMHEKCPAWQHTSVIPAFEQLRQEDQYGLDSGLGYVMRPCLKRKKEKEKG